MLSISIPSHPYQSKYLPAFLKKRRLEPQALCDGGSHGSTHALFPLSEYERVVEVLRSSGPLDLREVPPATLRYARHGLDPTWRCGAAEVEERYMRLPLALREKLLDFQREGVRRSGPGWDRDLVMGLTADGWLRHRCGTLWSGMGGVSWRMRWAQVRPP
jgi:hypothetical protein